MAYYLTVKGDKDYEIIDITKSRLFSRLSNLNKPGACDLMEIDAFTILFDNELQLKTQLYMEGLLTEHQCSKQLSIRNKYKNKFNKVMYDLLYQKDTCYFAPSDLKRELLSRSEDLDFLKQFVHHFYNNYDCRLSINELGVYLSDYSKTGNKNKYFDERYSYVIDLLMYKHNNPKEIKYANIHSMTAFISNYDRKIQEPERPKKRIKKDNQIIGQQSLFKD